MLHVYGWLLWEIPYDLQRRQTRMDSKAWEANYFCGEIQCWRSWWTYCDFIRWWVPVSIILRHRVIEHNSTGFIAQGSKDSKLWGNWLRTFKSSEADIAVREWKSSRANGLFISLLQSCVISWNLQRIHWRSQEQNSKEHAWPAFAAESKTQH